MSEIKVDPTLIAHCGLYCAACRKYLQGRCPGCHENKKASWCTVRSCCMEHHYASCADCKEHPDPMSCRLFNNFIARVFGFVFRSNRAACISKIRELGPSGFASFMAERGLQSLPRRS
jgi:hypothetical protein